MTQSAFSLANIERASGVLAALAAAPAQVRLAASRLTQAANRDNDHDPTVDACIGFEALVGDDNSELTHRLCQRTAAVLATRTANPADPEVVYQLMKKIYKHRSLVVHGSVPDKLRTITWNDKKYATSGLAISLLRDVLLERLERPGGWKPADLDALILQRLKPRSTST